jgi:hypothetical protein
VEVVLSCCVLGVEGRLLGPKLKGMPCRDLTSMGCFGMFGFLMYYSSLGKCEYLGLLEKIWLLFLSLCWKTASGKYLTGKDDRNY